MVKCEKCSKDAVIYLPYGKHNFCIEHFNYFFERRFKKTIRQFKLINNKDYIGVATSGGKDSMVLLYLINKIFKLKRIKFCAIFVDEGIKNYSNKTFKIVKEFCNKNNIKLINKSHKKEFDISTQDISEKYNKKRGSICTYCGVMRRKLINNLAIDEKITKLATGHNLDDEIQTVLMNMFDNNIIRFYRSGPISGITKLENTITRIKPFYMTPEKEIAAYALYNNIPFYKKDCPFFKGAKRNHFRKFINDMEVKFPGSKFSLIKSFLNIKENINKKKILNSNKNILRKCKICGATTSNDICASCKLLNEIKKRD